MGKDKENLEYSQEIGGELETSSGVGENPIYDSLVKEIFNVENINIKTDLSQVELILIARLEMYVSQFDNPLLASFLKIYKELKLSYKRKSRAELVQIFRTISGAGTNIDDNKKNRLLGFGREW